MEANYKTAKENWVSGLTGSNVLHINWISSVALCSIVLFLVLESRKPSWANQFSVSWLILVFPLLLSTTLFADVPLWLSIILLLCAASLLLIPRFPPESPLLPQSPLPSDSRGNNAHSESQLRIPLLPAVSIYRTHMLLMTILAILAVDFPVFPRSLAKCETFGFSLMDLGVGSFVYSQGLVSAIPILKNPSLLPASTYRKILSVTRKSIPIIFLGAIRVILVKGTKYPEHESEYGTHWNFFITLALLPIFEVFLHPVIQRCPLFVVGVLLTSAQQLVLSHFGMHDYILYAPRVNVWSANKEGLVSLLGYLAIHVIGLSTGTVILPSSPKYFGRSLKELNRQQRPTDSYSGQSTHTLVGPREDGHTAIILCSHTIIWWTLLALSRGSGAHVSRRMVNMPYIFWVAAFNTTFILGYLLVDLGFHPTQSIYSRYSKLKVPRVNRAVHASQQRYNAPALLEAFNKNGLVLFLLANVATGVVNLTLPTMYMSNFWSMITLTVYTFTLSGIAWIFRSRRLVHL